MKLKIGSAAPVNQHSIIETEVAPDSDGLLKILRPTVGVALTEVIRERREELREHLNRHGALLFRGFDISTLDAFNSVVESFSDQLMEYSHRSTPRTQLQGRIYTSTEYPPDQTIPLHNELSWTRVAPRYIWFCCLSPAPEGGATPIADSRKVHRLLPVQLREKFARHGIRYVRNYHPGVDLPWQDVFETQHKSDVDRYCTEQSIEHEWVSEEHLRTQQLCQAVVTHPHTGEVSWFNQAHLFHHTRVGTDGAESLLAMFGEENLPRNTYLGNGDRITDEELVAIRSAYDAALYRFSWQRGDLLLLDNLLCAHGRDPYAGARKVVVAMSDLVEL